MVGVILLIWALWLGGLVTLFMAVRSLFALYHDQLDVAGISASAIFDSFNAYQLGLALIALLAALSWRTNQRRTKTAIVLLIAAAGSLALLVTLYLAPKLESLREQGQTHTSIFAHLHGFSMLLYVLEVLLVLPIGPTVAAARERKRW